MEEDGIFWEWKDIIKKIGRKKNLEEDKEAIFECESEWWNK